jgi:hypothetical protein
MDAVFAKLIEQLNSGVFILLVILGVILWAVYRVARLIEQFSHHKTKIDKFDDLHSGVIELKVKVDLIYQNTNPNRLVAAQSPVSITPVGYEISTKINAQQIMDKYVGVLSDMVEATCPKNAYDVQAASMEVTKNKMMALLDAGEINAIKAVAYSKGLLAEDIMGIFGVMLRDVILKKKGLPVADVDKSLLKCQNAPPFLKIGNRFA